MACFISSNNNRFYVALEQSYAAVPALTAADRCSGVHLRARQTTEQLRRRDKTGTRTYRGASNRLRRQIEYEFRSYLTGSESPGAPPRHGAFFQAALGSGPLTFDGGTAGSSSESGITFSANHGLSVGQAVAHNDEIRVVAAIPGGAEIVLNAPFSHPVGPGSEITQTVTYAPSDSLPSIAIADYWDPSSAVQRLIHGAAVDKLELRVNGDFHEFTCSGPAADIIDTGSFENGQGGLSAFPAEPPTSSPLETPIPGHLGQIWLGISPTRMFTVLDAAVVIRNNVDLRAREFGSMLPRCMVPGQREVRVSFSLYERDDEATTLLYQAARQRTPVSIMMQLGEAAGQLCGVYVPSFIPEVPVFDDSETRVSWKCSESQAQGGIDDEIAIAFA